MATVQRHQVECRAKTPDCHVLSLATSPVNGDAGYPLQCLREVGVWEGTDVFSGNGVHDAGIVALDVRGLLQTLANASDDYLFHARLRLTSGNLVGFSLGDGVLG